MAKKDAQHKAALRQQSEKQKQRMGKKDSQHQAALEKRDKEKQAALRAQAKKQQQRVAKKEREHQEKVRKLEEEKRVLQTKHAEQERNQQRYHEQHSTPDALRKSDRNALKAKHKQEQQEQAAQHEAEKQRLRDKLQRERDAYERKIAEQKASKGALKDRLLQQQRPQPQPQQSYSQPQPQPPPPSYGYGMQPPPPSPYGYGGGGPVPASPPTTTTTTTNNNNVVVVQQTSSSESDDSTANDTEEEEEEEEEEEVTNSEQEQSDEEEVADEKVKPVLSVKSWLQFVEGKGDKKRERNDEEEAGFYLDLETDYLNDEDKPRQLVKVDPIDPTDVADVINAFKVAALRDVELTQKLQDRIMFSVAISGTGEIYRSFQEFPFQWLRNRIAEYIRNGSHGKFVVRAWIDLDPRQALVEVVVENGFFQFQIAMDDESLHNIDDAVSNIMFTFKQHLNSARVNLVLDHGRKEFKNVQTDSFEMRDILREWLTFSFNKRTFDDNRRHLKVYILNRVPFPLGAAMF
jgi:hypothetical protein